ncbi:MAG: hypothetical protein DME26_01620 [Verrucomicrobia bacterium]|nr:MAG: hypothetical protein DME26_01620 [Verrucomicrobiota bacterium]
MSNGAISKLRKIYDATHAFVTEKGIELYEENRASWFYRFAHFWLLVVKSFDRNKCPLRATALAYTTLLALVPFVALAVSISSAVFQEKGEAQIKGLIQTLIKQAAPQLTLKPSVDTGEDDGQQELINRIWAFISNIERGTLTVTSTFALILTAILLLSTIENTFNDIWGVSHGRSWFARIVQYWAVLSLGPILLAATIALRTGPHFQFTQKLLASMPFIREFLFPKLMPNTQVHWRAALLGGTLGGCLWMLNNVYSSIYLSRVAAFQTIYGKFATIPVFLVGLYFSWLIVLLGAQVSYAWQNRRVYLQEKKAESVNQRGREFIALRIMTYIAERFERRQPPPTLLEIAAALGIPTRLAGRLILPLREARLLVEVRGVETAYAPGTPLEKISCEDILHALRAGGGQELDTRDDPSRALVRGEFERIQDAERAVAGSVTLKELVNRTPASASDRGQANRGED